MRHGDKTNNLGRKKAHREALLSNLACELITHKRIVTTLAKAKALRVYVEPLITKSKQNTTHQRRIVFSHLQDKAAITELFSTVSEKIGGRPGGYTRVIKLGARTGDNAEMGMIELVDFNEIYGKGKDEQREGAKRTRRGGSKKKTETKAEEQTSEKAEPVAPAKEAEAE
jgi:large subunit ribosomal protein L17